MLQKAKYFISDFESKSFGREHVISLLYLFGSEIKKEQEEEIEDWKACHEHQLELMKGLNNRISELEQQIEKMKCCGNCAKRGHICVAEEMQGNLCGKNKDKWELRR